MPQKWIRITHPKAGEATVPESSLPHHMKAGWRPAEPRKPQQEQSPRRRRDTESTESEES